MSLFSQVDVSPSDIEQLSEDLRTERFAALQEMSNGKLADTQSEGDEVFYWPGMEKTRDHRGLYKTTYLFELCDGEQTVVDLFCEEHSDVRCFEVGTSRLVLECDTTPATVIKVARYGMSARFGDGRDGNRIEVERWQHHQDWPFLKIIDWDMNTYSWLMMPKAAPLHKMETVSDDQAEFISNHMKNSIEKLGLEMPLKDINQSNIGRYDGGWFLLDYAKPFNDTEALYSIFPLITKLQSE